MIERLTRPGVREQRVRIASEPANTARRLRVILGVAVALTTNLTSACDFNGNHRSDQASYDGVVTVQVVEGRPTLVGLSTDDGKYVLFYDSTTALRGIERTQGAVVWLTGQRYRIDGEPVMDEREVEAARSRGFDGIIMARRVVLLDTLR